MFSENQKFYLKRLAALHDFKNGRKAVYLQQKREKTWAAYVCRRKKLPKECSCRIAECVWGRCCGKRQKGCIAGYGTGRKPEAGTASVPGLPRCDAHYRPETGGNVNHGTRRKASEHLCDSQKLL